MELNYNYIPLPEIFWSFETGAPIRQCSLCNCDLLKPGTHYLIEKAFRERETIFEHALCLNCHAQCQNELSLDSRERIAHYFSEHIDFKKRTVQGLEQFGVLPEKWIEHCIVKGYPQQECGEYQLYGFCIDEDLVFNGAPYMLSGEVIDEIIELLSEATLGTLGDLSERLFGIDAPKDLLLL